MISSRVKTSGKHDLDHLHRDNFSPQLTLVQPAPFNLMQQAASSDISTLALEDLR